MTDNITPALIASLREMASKATPRPWDHCRARTGKGSYGLTPLHDAEIEPDYWERTQLDVAYMTAAANHLPDLLDEVERLREEAEGAKTASDYWYKQTVDCKFRIAELEAACEKWQTAWRVASVNLDHLNALIESCGFEVVLDIDSPDNRSHIKGYGKLYYPESDPS